MCQRAAAALRVPGADLRLVQACTRERFPSCKQLTVQLHSREQAVFDLPLALDALAGLTTLSQLVLGVDAAVANEPHTMAAALASLLWWQMRQQSALQPAPFNYSLTLSLDCSWQANEAVWQALGRLSQLSSLMIQTAAGDANETAVNMQHLSALAPLGSCLKQLELRITPVGDLQHQDYAFLSSLTTLTGLHLPVECDHVRLDSISCLTNLRSLELPAHRFAELVLDAAVYAAIAQLTQLTRLSLSSIELGSLVARAAAAAECAAAVRSLPALRQLTWLSFAPKYKAEVAALAALQQLRGLMARITLSSELRLNDLAAVGPLRGLTTLAIELPDVIELSCKRAKRVLSSVPHVHVVTLHVDARHVEAAARVVREAREAHAAAGIEWPAVVLVADLEPGWDA
ncbi:hypothetical protein OEZ85_002811 [Tetradesmus obliquus]|uniref:Uncharacterized protein n=1 Tax=Tetradesmus obliquus TaxID=3088 RepID=A0ABY8TZ50_TETOB|nr:hypothetical protein OEZ85_002811 [Tetradesmus obliquus]